MNQSKFYIDNIKKWVNQRYRHKKSNHIYYFFDDIINIKFFDPNNIKIDEKSYKNILIYYIGYVTIKDLKYVKINSVNPYTLLSTK